MKKIIELAEKIIAQCYNGICDETLCEDLDELIRERKALEQTPITGDWLKEHGWGLIYYNRPTDVLRYAIKMFGSDRVYWHDKNHISIFRNYKDGADVYADVLIDNIDTVGQLYDALDLCGIKI